MMTTLKPRKMQPHICARCGCHDVDVEHHADVVDFKGLTLEVDGLAETVCRSCGLHWTTEGQEQDNLGRLKEAYAKKRDIVRDREGLLTGQQIDYALGQLNLSKADAARLFGGGPNAFAKYINGDVLQSYAMDRLLRLTLAFGGHAVRYLQLGKDAPFLLNAGGYFVAPAVSGNATPAIFETLKSESIQGSITQVPLTQVETVQSL